MRSLKIPFEIYILSALIIGGAALKWLGPSILGWMTDMTNAYINAKYADDDAFYDAFKSGKYDTL